MIIQTYDLSKSYRKKVAVSQLDLSVVEGSIYGFLGPNGAGKTTSIRMLPGLIAPSQGDIFLFRAAPAQREGEDSAAHRLA